MLFFLSLVFSTLIIMWRVCGCTCVYVSVGVCVWACVSVCVFSFCLGFAEPPKCGGGGVSSVLELLGCWLSLLSLPLLVGVHVSACPCARGLYTVSLMSGVLWPVLSILTSPYSSVWVFSFDSRHSLILSFAMLSFLLSYPVNLTFWFQNVHLIFSYRLQFSVSVLHFCLSFYLFSLTWWSYLFVWLFLLWIIGCIFLPVYISSSFLVVCLPRYMKELRGPWFHLIRRCPFLLLGRKGEGCPPLPTREPAASVWLFLLVQFVSLFSWGRPVSGWDGGGGGLSLLCSPKRVCKICLSFQGFELCSLVSHPMQLCSLTGLWRVSLYLWQAPSL